MREETAGDRQSHRKTGGLAAKTSRERKAPKGLYHGATQLTNWGAQIKASTISNCRTDPDEICKNVIALLITYPNDQFGFMSLTVEHFRSMSWIDGLHADAITYVTSDCERRQIAEAIQSQGVPELVDSETFDKTCNELAEGLCDDRRMREGASISLQDVA